MVVEAVAWAEHETEEKRTRIQHLRQREVKHH
jgi:hypothetical protein